MNEHDLRRLLNTAAEDFTPVPSRGRMMVLLASPRAAARRLPFILGIAAGVAAVAGGAAALTIDENAIWAPSDRSVEIVVPDRLPFDEEPPPDETPTPGTVAYDDDAETRERMRAAEQARREAEELKATITIHLGTVAPRDHAKEFERELEAATEQAAEKEAARKAAEEDAAKKAAEEAAAREAAEKAAREKAAREKATTTTIKKDEPPPPTTTVKKEEPPPTTVKEIAFSANQKYGSCAENPPYDVFFGRAMPGTKIWIESAFGGAVTEANGDGYWEKKVYFETAPVNEGFKVVVESSAGHRKEFWFTRTG